MSFLKTLFGRTSMPESKADGHCVKQIEYKGFLIKASPYKDSGQYQTAGTVEKTIAGDLKQHRFIRADRFSSLQEATDFALTKGKQIVDEQGERALA